MMETQFPSGELVEHGISVEACGPGNLPHPFGTAFELSKASFSLSNLIPQGCAGLPTGWPGWPFRFDCSKLGGLAVDGGLE